MSGKKRTAIPRAVKDRVLKEFRHLCAVCGTPDPHLHHIDEDPSNNDPANLLPLCPNHHLSDQHDPTRRIEVDLLGLFRRHRDPSILTPEFEALFRRMRHLYSIERGSTQAIDSLRVANNELVAFIKVLRMGDFYHVRVAELFRPPPGGPFDPNPDRPWEPITSDSAAARFNRQFRHDLLDRRDDVERLVVELLRFQDWKYDHS